MKQYLIIFIILLLAKPAWAQHSSIAYHELADSLFEHHHYRYAAEYYEKALKKSREPGVVMLKIARSYSKLNEPGQAESWFTQARSNKASFSSEDTYLNAQVLAMQGKRLEAEKILLDLLQADRYANKEKQFLDDLVNAQKYYKDSARYIVCSLPINTSVSEFAPAFYKDGIVYASASGENKGRKKYHWDNSEFLNLYYSRNEDNNSFTKPSLFERNLNSRYHDGPVSFYNENNNMVVNRNLQGAPDKARDHQVWHLTLLDGFFDKIKSDWVLSPITFPDGFNSVTHPHISEDGKVLYFVSAKPGGYGGMDIYRSVRINGKWSAPFNLGPSINTVDDEAFPFAIDDFLYFASNGHGGIGGLDIFRCRNTVNGFTSLENVGYPINSNKDDFSIILTKDYKTGYFASSRNGNDDLFAFEYIPYVVHMAGHSYDGVTNEALAGTTVQIINSSTDDLNVKADEKGNFEFKLPEGTDFIMIGTNHDRVGMITGLSTKEVSKQNTIHQLAVFSDTSLVACIGKIKDSDDNPAKATSTIVIDETANETVAQFNENALINFAGKKNHTYRVQITNDQGDTTIHRLTIKPSDQEARSWTMVLKESMEDLMMAAKVFIAENNQPLSGAEVKITTFSEPQFELKTNEDGIVEYTLPKGTAYLVEANNGMFTGMLAGVAEAGTDKKHIIHPIPAYGDKAADENIIMALVTNEKGEIVKDAKVLVHDKASGDQIAVIVQDGVASFKGKHDHTYNISVEHADYLESYEEHVVQDKPVEVTKLSLLLKKETVPSGELEFKFRIIDASNESVITGAEVTVISFTENDQEIIADQNGEGRFHLPEGLAFMIVAKKDEYAGNLIGEAEKEKSQSFMTHTVFIQRDSPSTLVVAQVIDAEGNRIDNAKVTIVETKTGNTIEPQVSGGLVSFHGEPGKVYVMKSIDSDHQISEKNIKILPGNDGLQKITMVMNKNVSIEQNAIPSEKPLPVLMASTRNSISVSSDKLIIFQTESGEAKAFLQRDVNLSEITEDNAQLFLERETGRELIGTGTLRNLLKDEQLLSRINIPAASVVLLKNIYFDFNNAIINEVAAAELMNVIAILKNYPSLKLLIRAHADDRGQDAYNYYLSGRRTKAVLNHLVNSGVPGKQIVLEPMGETAPAVRCADGCSEEDHGKNRRAEFFIRTDNGNKPLQEIAYTPSTKPKAPPIHAGSDNAQIKYKFHLDRVGEKMKEGLEFRISVGAYRYKPALSFEYLNDLGVTQKLLSGEITHYYLGQFNTLKEAEKTKEQVIARGVPDAYIVIFYNNKVISFKEFLELVE